MQTIAIFPAAGIGDALLMMIAAEQFQKAGYFVTLYHDKLPEMASWFPGHDLRPIPHMEHLKQTLRSYQLIIAENDNSPFVDHLIQFYRPVLSIFYPSYKKGKHPSLDKRDQCFNSALPMAENIRKATETLLNSLFGLKTRCDKKNGISPPPSLRYRVNPLRVLIHPSSSRPEKNWKASYFVRLAIQLKKRGLFPVFVIHPQESREWEFVKDHSIFLEKTSSLADLASLVFESGFVIGNDSLLGHLASNLTIPSLVIADDRNRLKLWRPGWLPSRLVFPLRGLPRPIKKNHWQRFLSVRKALRAFQDL